MCSVFYFAFPWVVVLKSAWCDEARQVPVGRHHQDDCRNQEERSKERQSDNQKRQHSFYLKIFYCENPLLNFSRGCFLFLLDEIGVTLWFSGGGGWDGAWIQKVNLREGISIMRNGTTCDVNYSNLCLSRRDLRQMFATVNMSGLSIA